MFVEDYCVVNYVTLMTSNNCFHSAVKKLCADCFVDVVWRSEPRENVMSDSLRNLKLAIRQGEDLSPFRGLSVSLSMVGVIGYFINQVLRVT